MLLWQKVQIKGVPKTHILYSTISYCVTDLKYDLPQDSRCIIGETLLTKSVTRSITEEVTEYKIYIGRVNLRDIKLDFFTFDFKNNLVF